MSKRAEEAGLRAYPFIPLVRYDLRDENPTDGNKIHRRVFMEGYEQAEKDLALTINDLELLHTFLYAVKNNKQGAFTFTRLSDEQYQEVLKRFKKMRYEK